MATTSLITGRVPLPSDDPISYAELTFTLSGLDSEGSDVFLPGISKRVVLVDSEIPAGFDLWRNTEGYRGTNYKLLARWVEVTRDGKRDRYAELPAIQIGDDAEYEFASLLMHAPFPAPSNSYWSSITQEEYNAAIEAAAQAQAFGAAYDKTDAEMLTITIPAPVKLIHRFPLTASVGQVAPVLKLTTWYRWTGSTEGKTWFADASGAVFVLVGLTEELLLSVVGSAINGLATDPVYGVAVFSNLSAFTAANIPAPIQRVAVRNGNRVFYLISDTNGIFGPTADGRTWSLELNVSSLNVGPSVETQAVMTAQIWQPTVTVTNVGDVLADGKYNSMAGLGRMPDGDLFAVWNGNDTAGLNEGAAGQNVYMSRSADDGATFGAKYTPFTSGTYSSNPFAGSGTLWMQAAPVSQSGKALVAWTCGRGATDKGLFLSSRESGLWTNGKLLQRASDGVIELRPELTVAAAPVGYSHEWTLDGEAWFPTIQFMKVFDGRLYAGLTLYEPTGTFGVIRRKSVVMVSDDVGATWALGQAMPNGVIQPKQPWEWDVIRLPDGRFRAIIRVDYENGGDGAISSTQVIAYKYAIAESGDLMGWTAPTFAPLATHKLRPSTADLGAGFWGLATLDSRLGRNREALHIIRNGGAIASAVRVSNEVLATEWAHTSSAFMDPVTGLPMVVWSAGYNTGFTAPAAIRVSKLSSLPNKATFNVIPEDRDDPAVASGNIITFPGTACAGIDTPLHDYTLTFKADLIGPAMTGTQNVVFCSVGSAQAGLQVQQTRDKIEVVPISNGRVGNALVTLIDTAISVTVSETFVQINGNRFTLPGAGEFHFGDYHGTGTDLTATYLSLDVSKIRVTKGAYANPTTNWSGWSGRNVIRNGNFQWDQKNSGATYGASVGTKLDGWSVFDAGSATFSMKQGVYSVVSAAQFGGVRTHMQVLATVLGATDTLIGQAFEGAEFLSGRLTTLAIDLHNLLADRLQVTVEWWQMFGTGGSPSATIKTRLWTLYVDGQERRHNISFIVPQIPSSSTFGTDPATSYSALVFRLPLHVTLADLRFGRTRLCEGLQASGYGADNDDQVKAEFVAFRAVDANTVFCNGYMHSTTEFRGALNYGIGPRVPTLEATGSFEIAGSGTSAAVTTILARAGLSTAELRVTSGLSGFTAWSAAVLRARADPAAALFLNRRPFK